MKRSLCIISCGSKKVWDKKPDIGYIEAKNAYTGNYFKKNMLYASTFYKNWVILSAKYGFLYPDQLIEGPYDLSFNMSNPNVINIEQLKKQVREKNLFQYEEIVVLGGSQYVKIVKEVYGNYYNYCLPFKNCKGIGHMMQILNNAIKTGIMLE